LLFFCGTGNNGGDGLAVARMLKEQHFEVMVFLFNQGSMSEDCRQNLDRLEKEIPVEIAYQFI
jgi:ADP-dependent NAD(P)H-hydrate dehydratase / NAD(P)H-hydrate epimerase